MTQTPDPRDYDLARSALKQFETCDPACARAIQPSVPGYELICAHHCGGQGVVYQAVQQSTGKEVAIKFLRGGSIASPGERARMEREVRILARLKHPDIVRIYDSGVTDEGLDYFVMDFVDGEQLDRFAGATQLTLKEKLRLMGRVADAVHHAHLHGVVHRDLKPSNILVDDDAQPHILDFGLAKLSMAFDEITLTRTGQLMGSLPWSAPEQLVGNSDDVDLRSDVYALGVLLYQVVTGRFPYDVSGPPREAMDQILTSDPQRPSLRQKGLDDEIDTIVLKCLSKDRERRYQSAGTLAQDLQRYLRGEAIDARRDSSWYVFSKTLRRHRVSLVVVIAFMVTIILGLAISLHQWRRAERELTRANQIKSVLLQVFDTVDPAVAQGQDTTLLRHMMELAEQQLTPDLDALVEADLRNTLGMVYSSLDDLERANSNYTRALELRRGALGDSHPLTADSIHNLGKLRFQERRYEQAFEIFEEALVATRRSLGENDPYVYNVMNDMAQTLPLLGDPEAALPLQRAALEGYEAGLGDDHPSTLAAMHNMGMLLRKLGRLEDAELYYRRALPGLRRVLGNDDPTTLACINNLGFLMRKLDRPEEAETYYREALRLRQQTLGPDHEATLISINNLAGLLLDTGNVQEAESLLREGEPVARRRWADSGLLGVYLTKLGTALSHNGAFAEAENILNEAYESLIANYGLEHRHTLKAVSAIADLYQSWNRREPSDEREALAAEWHARLAQPDTSGDSESR